VPAPGLSCGRLPGSCAFGDRPVAIGSHLSFEQCRHARPEAGIIEHEEETAAAVLLPEAFGKEPSILVWQRILFPDGSSVRLDNMPATDAAGYAGLEDKVDFHEWRLLKGIVLSSLLGVGSEFSSGGGQGDLIRALRDSAWQNGARAGDQIVSRNLDVQPTLTVRPGWPVRAIVHKDLVLKPWRG
jgi:hypothetical protein